MELGTGVIEQLLLDNRMAVNCQEFRQVRHSVQCPTHVISPSPTISDMLFEFGSREKKKENELREVYRFVQD